MKVVLKPIPQHAEIQKLRNWKEPSSEEETTTMISNDVWRDFHTSMMSGGLFDDENKDSDLFGSQSANIWSHTTRTYDASSDTGTHLEKHEKERSIKNDFLVSEPDKQKFELRAVSSPKKPSFLHSDETFPTRSYAHVHDSLFTNESTSSLSLKDTLSFLRKGSFEDDADESENMDLFGPSNGTTSLEEIDGTDFGDSAGNFKGISSSSNCSAGAKANLVDEISEKADVARGASFDFGNEAAASEAGLIIKEPDSGNTNNNIEGLSSDKFTLSSPESLSETRREIEEVSSVSGAEVVAHEKSNSERMCGYDDNRNRLLTIKTPHILDEEKVLDAKSDDDVASWSNASSTADTFNLGKISDDAFLANGFKPEEPHQQIGNLEFLAEHPTHEVEEVTDSSHSEFSTNVVKRQYGDESGEASTNILAPPMTKFNSSSEKTNEDPQNISSNWSRKLTFLQEHLSQPPTMFSPQIPRTQSNIFVDDEKKIFTRQTQRPSLQAPSQDMNSLHHATMSRPRGPKRRAPTSSPPLLMTNTQEIGNSSEEGWSGDPSPHFVDSIEKTEAFSRTNDTMLHLTFENTLSNEGVADDTLSISEGFTKSLKKTTDMGFADKSEVEKSQAGPSNTFLCEHEHRENDPFGPLQGMVYTSSSSTSPLLESQVSQGLAGSDKDSAKGDFMKGPEGAVGKVPGQTLKHQLSPRECFRRSLFDDDDDEDDKLFS